MGLDPLRAVAIIGMGVRFPGAENVEKYRRNLRDGVVSIREVPRDRWEPELYYDPDPGVPDKTYSKIGGFLEPYKPDYRKWRMPPRVAENLDTTQILALTITQEALEDSGYSGKDFDRARCGVILGNSMGGDLRDYSAGRLALAGFLRDLENNDIFGELTSDRREAIIRDVQERVLNRHPAICEDTMAGELANVVAGRVAAAYKLTGPNFTVDAACASSLAAVNAAVHFLRSRECDMVVTGGVDRNMSASSFVKFCKTNALSPDRSTPFDEGANGFVMGEGGGILILKRLEDARRDRDKIRGVILGCGSSSDGGGKGITAPNPRGQIHALTRAYKDAGVSPETMGYMEAHGTSTKVGDDAEIRTIALLLEDEPPKCGFLPIGSSKAMFGHLKSAAGAAGMVKTALALENKEIYPTTGYEKPNAALREIKPPVRIPTTFEEWKNVSDTPRRACVSAFGFGGTNFHIVMEETSEPGKRRRYAGAGGRPAAISGNNPTSDMKSDMKSEAKSKMKNKMKNGKEIMTAGKINEPNTVLLRGTGLFRLGAENKDDLLSEISSSLEFLKSGGDAVSAARKMGQPIDGQKYRLAFVGSNTEELIVRLEEAREFLMTGKGILRLSGKGTFIGSEDWSPMAFLFPGQGSQYVGMLKDLLYLDVVRETIREADEVMYPILDRPLSDFMLGDAESGAKGRDTAAEAALRQTMVTQPAVLTADIAILRLMEQLGLKPDMVAGHSLGEYAACVAAGVLGFGKALRVVAARGREMTDAVPKGGDPGLMAVVSGPSGLVEAHLSRITAYVTAANKNSPNQTVIAGSTEGVRQAENLFKEEGLVCRTIPVSHAFHTRVVAGASEPLRRVLERSGVEKPSVDIFSNVTADFYPETTDEIIDLLARQVASPVEFIKIVEKMYELGAGTFVEIGPKRALYGFVKDILTGKPHRAVLTNHPKKGGPKSLAEALSSLAAAGAPVAPTAFGEEKVVKYSPPIKESGSSGPVSGSSAPNHSGSSCSNVDIWITGAAVGLPGREKVFSDDNMEELLDGKLFLSELDEITRGRIADNKIVRLVKSEDGTGELRPIESADDVMTWAGRGGKLDLQEEYLVPADWDNDKDPSTRLAVGAAFEALRDAWLPLVEVRRNISNGKSLSQGWRLPEKAGNETGVIFASAFAGHTRMLKMVEEIKEGKPFPRSALLQMLAIGHAHVAELFGAYGPNLQINTACASTTTALSIAQDWIRLGRCRRVLIIAGDDVTSDELMPWVGGGFLAVGAATTERRLDKAAIPFGAKRNGLILGMGAVGLVVERADSAKERGIRPLAELVGSLIANSGSHPMRLRPDHIAVQMSDLVGSVCERLSMTREELARDVVFMSHETYTPARGGSAQAEADALRKAFGEHVHHVIIVNTKGFTGHTMAVGLEDGLLPAGLYAEKMPRVANLHEPDPEFADLSFHQGGTLKRRFAIRLAAGFGSQLAMSILRRGEGSGLRVDEEVFRKHAEEVYHIRDGKLILDRRTLRALSVHRSSDEELPDALTEASAKQEAEELNAITAAEETMEPAEHQDEALVEAAEAVSTRPAVTSDEVLKRLMEVVSEKTGYDIEELEGDLELEADLGVDTVKQAEIMAKVREEYGMERDENFRLSDHPTLEAMAGYVASNLQGGEVSERAAVSEEVSESKDAEAAEPAEAVSTRPAVTSDEVLKRLMEVVSEKTGYDIEELEGDLELEADLGVDTVKQAEIMAKVREEYGMARDENFRLSDHPTLEAMAGYVASNLQGGEVSERAAVSEEVSESKDTEAAEHQNEVLVEAAEAVSTRPAVTSDEVLKRLMEVVSEKTGYDIEELEGDLELEADLGVDTVKQAEIMAKVREEYGMARDENFRLSDHPTLEAMAGYVTSNLRGGEVSERAAVSEEVSESKDAEAVSTKPAVTSDEVLKRLMEVVSEKTGYDIEELEGDLELEADLGVDTVKQAEIMAKVREEYGMARDENFRLSDHPTLEAMAGYVASNLPGGEVSKNIETISEEAEPVNDKVSDAWDLGDGFLIRRVAWDGAATRPGVIGTMSEKSPFSDETFKWIVATPSSRLDGCSEMITGMTGVSNPDFECIDWNELASMDDEKIFRKLESRQGSGRWGVLCLVDEEMKESPVSTVYGAFRLARVLASRFAVGNEPNVGYWLSVFSVLEGKTPEGSFAGAMAGLTRSLGHEWPSCTALEIPDTVVSSDMKLCGLHIRDTIMRRVSGEPVQTLSKFEGAQGFNLDREAVVLITGALGGLGDLTARLIKKLWNCRIVLVDLAKRPGKSTEYSIPGRKELRERLKKAGKRPTPRALDAEMDRLERELAGARLLEDLEEEPGKLLYFSADLRKEEDIKVFMREVKSRWGRLDMVIHGAGVEISRPLAGKSDEEIQLTLGAKTEAARTIHETTLEVFGAPAKRFIGYGSVAGVLGNPGQTDYSAANAGLGGFASFINATQSDSSALIIHWTGWDGMGMTRFAWIRESLEARGLDLLEREKGVEAMARLFSGNGRGEVLVSGRLGELEPEKGPEKPSAKMEVKDRGADDYSDKRAESDSGEVESTLTLDASEKWLVDHMVDGTRVLPGVAGTEFMAHAVKKLAGDSAEIAELQNLRFHKALRLSANRRTEARARAWWINKGIKAGAVLESITHGKKGPVVREHFTAEFLFEQSVNDSDFEGGRDMLNYDPLDIGILNGAGPGREEIYEHFFHGPSFQVLKEVKLAGGRGLTAYAGDRALGLNWVDDGSQLTAPLALEAAFQAAGFHCLMFDGASVLPTGAARTRWIDPSMIREGSPWVVRVVRVESNEHESNESEGPKSYLFDAHVLNDEGRLLMAVWNLEMAGREMVQLSRKPSLRSVMEVVEMPLSALGGEDSMVVDPAGEMSQGEMRELARIENVGRRMEWMAGRLAAKELVRLHLRDHYGKIVFRKEIEIATEAGGAPMPWIPSRPEMGSCLPALSITHACGRAIVLGLPFSEQYCRVGVDLVSTNRRDESFARQWLSDHEQELVNKFKKREGEEKAFLARDESIAVLWGIKEAVSKALGLGLHLTSAEMEIQELMEGGRASVVLTGEALRRYDYLRGGALSCGWRVSDGVATAWAVLELRADTIDGVGVNGVDGEQADSTKPLPVSSYKL